MELAWLYGWEPATLPLPVLLVAGLVLAIAANADKQIRIKVRRPMTTAERSPDTPARSTADALGAEPRQVLESRPEAKLPMFQAQEPQASKAPVSFDIQPTHPKKGDRPS